MLGSPDDFGLSLVILSLVFAVAALIRRWSRPLRALFIPTAVIGGFLALALGPEGVGRFTGGDGIFSTATFAVWKALPGLLINVMCAALLLGERLPPVKTIWNISGPHVIMAGIMSGGQFAVASILTLLLLEPVFGFSSKAGALIEMAFAGGHGTLAGLTPVLVDVRRRRAPGSGAWPGDDRDGHRDRCRHDAGEVRDQLAFDFRRSPESTIRR